MKQIKEPERVRQTIKDYYRTAELWYPENKGLNWAFFKFESLNKDGSTNFIHVVDRVDSKETLREHLIDKTPINVYWSVSRWLNPSITRHKTYKSGNDGRMHRDKNGFMYTDAVIDHDHKNTEQVEKCYNYLHQEKGIPGDKMYFVFSGGGWHINIDQYYRKRDIADPIQREKDAYIHLQNLCEELDKQGIDFDFTIQSGSYNSPTGDTRRVRKLPGTITEHGNIAEVVSKTQLHSYTGNEIVNIEKEGEPKQTQTLSEEIEEVKALGKAIKS